MKVDIPSAIAELLYEHQTVVIPGLGAFTTDYKPAAIDQVQGVLTPPSKNLDFDTNLLVNDGLLVHYIQKKYEVTAEQAEALLDDFVTQILSRLDKKETVDFPKVGKLYKDFENNLKFLPGTTNFNTDSFGLPEVRFFPILRKKAPPVRPAAATQTAAAAATQSTEKVKEDGLPLWLRILLPVLGILSVIVLIFSVYMLQSGGSTHPTPPVDTERLNKKPSDVETADDPEDLEDLKAESPEQADSPDSEGATADTEAPTPAPDTREAFIIIHSFGNPDNVKKFMQKLMEDGFQPKSEKVGKLTSVGAVVTYESDSELDEIVAELKKLYNTTPRVRKMEE